MTVIDETGLESAVRDAGGRLEVPADGPARVLQSRPPRDGRRRARYTTWGALAGAAALVAVVAVAVAGGSGGSSKGSSSGSSASASAPAFGAAHGAPAVAGGQASASTGAGAARAAGSSGAQGSGGLPDVVPKMPTRVVKTGTVDLQVPFGQAGDTISRISSQAGTLQGFVSTSSIQNMPAPGPGMSPPPASGSVTVRVPVSSFEGMVSFVQKLGTPTSVSTSGQDVTNSYVDLQARIGTLQAARTQFEQILARATTIGDILSVENQINDLQTQVEQLQGQLNVLDDQTSYSTLTVNVSEQAKPGVVPHPAKPAGGLAGAWDHARGSFVHGVEAVIAASGGVAVFLLFTGLVLGAGWYGWRRVGRRLV